MEVQSPSLIARRRFLQAAGLTAAGVAVLGRWPSASARAAPASPLSPGLTAVRSNLHTHGSMSECDGAIDGHLAQARANGFGYLLMTDHDTLMHQNQVSPFRFAGVQQTVPQGVLTLVAEEAGNLATGASRSFPTDPTLGRSVLTVSARSAGPSEAKYGYRLASKIYQHPTVAQTPVVQLRVDQVGQAAYCYVRFDLSFHPAYAAIPAGNYALEYRFYVSSSGATARSFRRFGVGRLGVVWVPVTRSVWSAPALDVMADLAQMWPGAFQPGDNAMPGVHFGVGSSGGALAEGAFANYELSRPASIDLLASQRQLLAAYQTAYTDVIVDQGIELSRPPPQSHHVNQLGGTILLGSGLDYGAAVTAVHQHGGIASINHPFGTDERVLATPDVQQELLRQAIDSHLSGRYFGADMLEIYPDRRGTVDMARHVELWDVASRNGLFLTAVSSNDDHGGKNWLAEPNPGYTSPYVSAVSTVDVQAALAAGRSFVGVLGRFAGQLDFMLGGAPMGAVWMNQEPVQDLRIYADQLPAGSAVQVVQGPVDYAGGGDPTSGATVTQTISAARFSDAPFIMSSSVLNTFTRVQVVDSAGIVIALSQPVWYLEGAPPAGVPISRRYP